MSQRAGPSSRVVIVGAGLLCAFGLVVGHRCRDAAPRRSGSGPVARQTPDTAPPAFEARLVGRVTDLSGMPVAGARATLAVWVSRAGIVPVVAVLSDRRGRLAIPVGRPGTYHVMVSMPGQARWHRRVTVSAPGELDLGKLRLAPGQAIQGRVVDPLGEPIPFARVSAVGSLERPARPLEPGHRVLADAKGRFRIPGLLARAYRVTVKADGHGSSVLREVVAPAVGLRVTLRPLRVIAGRVTAKGAAAQGATVELAGSGVWPPIRTITDVLGRFRFSGVREGIYELRARRGRWVSAPAPAVDLLGSGALPEVELELLEGAVFVGRVLDARTRKPLGRVRVTAARDLLAVNPLIAQTTRDGSFVLEPLLPGEYRLTLDRDGYLPSRGILVTVLPGRNPPVELTMHLGGVLSGVVIDDTGREVFGARIEVIGRARGSYIADRSAHSLSLQDTLWEHALRSLNGPRSPSDGTAPHPGSLGVMPGPLPFAPAVDSPGDLTTATGTAPLSGRAASLVTDKKGRFRVVGVPPGNLSLVVRHASYARAKSGPYRLKRGQEKNGIVIRLGPGTALEGTVLDPIGKPIAGVQVAVADPADPYHYAVRITDAKGLFRVPNLKGRVRLSLSAPGRVPLVHQLRIGKAPNPHRVSLTLQPADCRVDGRIVDSHRLPVQGARVSLLSVTPDAPSRGVALSDRDGRFAAKGLGKISYRVTVQHESFPDHHFELRCPSPSPRWKLSYGGGLSFEVRDKQTRASIRSFAYVLRRAGGPVIRRDGFAGKAQEVPIPAGRYELVVRAPTYAQRSRKIYVPAGRLPKQVTRRRVVVWLELAGSVEGHVRDDRGLAVEGAVVKVAGLEGRTDAKGRFTVRELPPGTHELVASHPDRGTGRLTGVVVKAGLPTVSLVIDLSPGGDAPKAVKAGVPITLAERDDKIVISGVTAGSSAEKAGLAKGDELVTVDGRNLDGLGLADIASLLHGPSGTSVVLEIIRQGRTTKLSVKREILTDD